MTDSHVAAGLHLHLAEEAHTLIGRTRIPVHETDIRFARLCTEHLHSQHILRLDIGCHIERELTIGACHLILACHQMTIQPDVGTIADTIEGKQDMLLGTCINMECGTIPPTDVETALVNTLIVGSRQCLRLHTIHRQHTHHSRRDSRFQPSADVRCRGREYITCRCHLCR